MSAAVYWDTSALIKLYAPEPDANHFRSLFRDQIEPVAISFLHRVELYYALVGKESRGEIAQGGAEVVFDAFQRHRQKGHFLEIPWGDDVEHQARHALNVCSRQAPPVMLRSLDGLHLGAMLVGGINRVVSTDIRFCKAAACLGLTVL